MKRILSAIILLSIFSLVFVSCKKNSDSNNSNPVPVSSDYLSRMIYLSNDGSGTEVKEGSITYVFDNLKRVTHVIDSSAVGSSAVLELWETTEYFYNGNDTLPYKSVVIGNPAAQTEYDTTINFYTYNAAGLLIRDTGYYAGHTSTDDYNTRSNQTYTYSGSMITGRRDAIVTYGGFSNNETRIDTAHTDANGNIIQNIKHKDLETINSTITWDNHPSPFAKLSNFRASLIFPFGETFFYEMPQYNNRLHITELTTGGSNHTYDEDFTGRYSYNANGYPTQILQPDPAVSGAYEKYIFEYKSL